jgi:hypothetical protein
MFKTLVASLLLLAVLSIADAHADNCSLTVGRSSPVLLGQPVGVGEAFGFGVNIGFLPLPGPWPPGFGPDSYNHFTIVFYGSKDGTPDIGPGGQAYPGEFPLGSSTLMLTNPGGLSGTYDRYAVIYWPSGFYCMTNTVTLTLL